MSAQRPTILKSMQPSAAVTSSQQSPTFAGLLAAFTEPQKRFPPAQDEIGIADDIVTLSYEHALRNHARYRSEEDSGGEQGLTAGPDSPRALPSSSSEQLAASDDAAALSGSALMEKNLKRASITIRLSQSDCAQLHQRAAEAGLSMSAYLRSCALEVESLRGQVKQTLAQLRSATSSQNSSSHTTSSGNKHPSSLLHNAGSRPWSKLWLHLRAHVIPA